MKLYEIVSTSLPDYNIFIGKVGHYCDCEYCKDYGYTTPPYFSIPGNNSLITEYLQLKPVILDKDYLKLLEEV